MPTTRLRRLLGALLLACGACAPTRGPAAPGLLDVSGDDCTASAFVFDRTPAATAAGGEGGTPFINDGCSGDRIFLGVNGERRELTRRENVSLGEGGPYSDGTFRVLVERGRELYRRALYPPGEAECGGEGETEYEVAHAARVRIWSGREAWVVDGTLVTGECRR